MAAADAVGIIASDAAKELQVISDVSGEQYVEIEQFLNTAVLDISQSDKPYIFHIRVEVSGDGHKAIAEIAGQHTNVIHISSDDTIILKKDYTEEITGTDDYQLLMVEDIISFADCVKMEDIKKILSRQIEYNMAIAEEGLKGTWGANIGTTLLSAYGNSTHNKAKAYAAAGSDARMNGCEMPVIINSGSGNQGMTTSIPVIVYAKDLGVNEEILYRALVVANLITIHMKTGIGRLSAYCGATSAGCGAAAGISYLHGGKQYEIAHTIVNAVAINSGMICDGAKASCAAKIASAVEAGLLGWQMQRENKQFYSGEGIVTKGVDNTIRNVGRMARHGMAETDREIIRIMMEKC